MSQRPLNKYTGLDNRDLKARSVLTWREKATARLKRFIEVWEAASSLDEVMSAMNMRRRQASYTATYLRLRHGVKLKKFPHAVRRKLDSKDLQAHLNHVRASLPPTLKHQP